MPGCDDAQSNGDVVSDQQTMGGEERLKPCDGEEGSTEKSTPLCKGQQGEDSSGSTGNGKNLVHSSHSQQEFFRMLDEKIEKGPDYCSEEEDAT